jgi:hypothetical protein
MVNVEVEGHSSWGLSRKNREKAGCSLASRIPMRICLVRKKKKTRFDGISVIFLNIRDGRFETRSQGWWMKIDTGIREVAPFL